MFTKTKTKKFRTFSTVKSAREAIFQRSPLTLSEKVEHINTVRELHKRGRIVVNELSRANDCLLISIRPRKGK